MKLLLAVAASACVLGAQPMGLPLMPWPENVVRGQGRLPITSTFSIGSPEKANARVTEAVQRITRRIAAKTGLQLGASGGNHVLNVSYRSETPKYPKLGADESYRLTVTPQRATLEAETDLGVLRGLETFEQLVSSDGQGFGVPAVTIEDKPRFAWRGLMLDVGRHFLPMEVIKRNLDGMAAVKMNVLHIHLADDQGFRVESKLYPKLQEKASDGKFFSQDQLREIIDYAAARGIRVMPEFDIPGHSTALLTAYPELGSMPGPYTIERGWGIFDPTLDPTKEEVYKFLDGFIGEMAGIFPDAFFHIGGDEVSGKHWTRSQRIAAFKREHGMKTNEDLHVYFNKRLLPIVTGHGKVMVGWDEILHPQLPKETVVQSWRGPKGLAEAARAGYRTLLSNGYYVDLIHSAEYHYAVDPAEKEAAGLTAEEQQRVLGGEACMWSEYVGPETVDSRVWPRTAAIAERFWSPQDIKDPASMYTRLAQVSVDLEHVGLTHRSNYTPMLERIAGGPDTKALRVLADVVEPVKDYKRGSLKKETQLTPLNRLVDAARPESDTAREFGLLVTRYLTSKRAEDAAAIRRQLTTWRDNHAALEPLFAKSALMTEVRPVSLQLQSAATVGLQALNALESGKPVAPGWPAKLKAAEAPSAQVLVMVVPHIRRLAAATTSGTNKPAVPGV